MGLQGKRLVSAVLAALAICLLFAATAQAGTGVVSSFGGEGSGAGEIATTGGVAVNETTGDVYVADVKNLRIDRFDAEGNFELAWGWGVADGSAEAQVCVIFCQAGLSGAGDGQLGGPSGPRGVAVDQSDGSVYVVDSTNFRIEKFDADGTFERTWGWGVADGASAFQVCTESCRKGLSATGAGGFRTISLASLAVDPTNGHVLVTDPTNIRVQEFTSEGAFVRTFGRDVQTGGVTTFEVCTEAALCKVGVAGTGTGQFGSSSPRGVAVSSTGVIYTSEQSVRRIQKFTPAGETLEPSVFFSSALAPQGLGVDFTDDHLVTALTTLNSPAQGLELDPSGSEVETYFGLGGSFNVPAIAVNGASGLAYAIGAASAVYVLGPMEQPTLTIQPVTDVTSTTATANAEVNDNGAPAARYTFEYSLEGSGTWDASETVVLSGDSEPHQISVVLDPPAGLEPGSTYQVRLVAEKPGNEKVVTEAVEFTTPNEAPMVETVGSPFRTATTAQLEARVNPRGEETTYRFEYGPTTAYGDSVPAGPETSAGSGFRSVLAAAEVTGLEPATTYHYRVVATNATGATFGDDMTLTTRTDDKALSHGDFSGPPGSDRAYEQVNLPDTGGNPVMSGYGFSDDGNRAIYQVSGGTPQSDNGTLMNQFFAERTDEGWETSSIWPPRSAVDDLAWVQPFADNDLSKVLAQNQFPGASEWLLGPGLEPQKILDVSSEEFDGFYMASEDLSRFVILLKGPVDPEYPAEPGSEQLYDFTTGTPHLISLLPDGTVPGCGVPSEGNEKRLPANYPTRSIHWISADGSRVFFPSAGNATSCADGNLQLYMRDLPGNATVRVSGEALSGKECPPAFIKSNEESVFFWSQARLDPVDTEQTTGDCTFSTGNGGDVYRYDFEDGELACLTCVVPGADVESTNWTTGAAKAIAIAADGSRVYFTSPHRLVEGEGEEGARNVYRLDVASGELKFVSPDGGVGEFANVIEGQGITPDGSVIVFRAEGEAMNGITSGDNGGRQQYYRYDDRDGSLVCISCPQDGSPGGEIGKGLNEEQVGPNLTPIDAAGDFVFVTGAPLVAADQNTAQEGERPIVGYDVYEWRDGRVLLITDGQTTWPDTAGDFAAPGVAGISPSGRDVFFLASTALTPDAPDGFKRLYDARLGGGFEFPPPPPPCPLEVCQGEAKGAPEDPTPGSTTLQGAGNVAPEPQPRKPRKKCGKHKVKVGKKCKRRHVKHPKPIKKHAHKTGRAH